MVLDVILALIGFFVGLKMPDISWQIMKRKLRQNSTRSLCLNEAILYSKIFRMASAISNCLLWVIAAIFIDNVFIAIILGLLLTLTLLFSIIDIFIRTIPNELVIAALIVGGLFQFTYYGIHELLIALLSMFVIVAVFVILGLIIGLEKVGVGDVKLAAVMAISLGYANLLTAMFIMSVFLIIFSILGLLTKRLTTRSMLPFAPFMMAGMLITYITIMVNNVK